MIRVNIATAALREQAEQRIRIAAPLLAAYGIRAQVNQWDGTRCSLVVVDLSDAYGQQVSEIAKKRGTPILAFGSSGADHNPDITPADDSSPAPVLAMTLKGLLIADASGAQDIVIGGPQPALCRLADSQYAGRDIDAAFNGRIVRLRPERGRIYAPTLSDLLSALDTFASSAWTLKIVGSDDGHYRHDGASRSLEAFLLQSAFNAREQLPMFPEGRYRLKDWPDVGSAPGLVGALKVAKVLMNGPANVKELSHACRIDAQSVNATLWAYRSANLLEGQHYATEPMSPPQTIGVFSGMLARLANKFGLNRD